MLSNGIYLFNVRFKGYGSALSRYLGRESPEASRISVQGSRVFTSLKLDLVFLYHNNRVRRKLCAHSLQESRPLVYVGVLQWWIQIKSNINPHVAKNEPKLVLVRCENASVSFT
jgi:hypothetical protein